MDELLHHCLRELSFDGDLGCNVSRLRDFIVEFYANNGNSQNPDDAFCAFVWSLVVQQPTIRVGTVPPEVTSEVWIAPQSSAKRKAKAKGQGNSEAAPARLHIVHAARDRALDDLKREHGDNLRIAVDPDAIYAAITGSHIRFAKLSPMVYSALQIITRGRDNGVTVVQLGQRSGYDQKTCFYLVKQLTDLDLVIKVRRGGVGTHFVLHKHFFERSPSWQAIRDEEVEAESSHSVIENTTAGFSEDEERGVELPTIDFSPIDARHLSSLPLVRARVLKLLKASKNCMYICNNMLRRIGFSNPTKTDRRFFRSRIRELIQQGIIQQVIVPSNRDKSAHTSVRCFRLVSKDRKGGDEEGVVIQPQDNDDEDKDPAEQPAVKMNITIHKQILDLLEESGTIGMTLNEMSSAMCQLDKRTIELFLARAEKYLPPSHLGDLGIAGLMETSGRERRHRYFTVASYRQLMAKENHDSSGSAYSEADLSNMGGFLPVENDLFYDDQAALLRYQDAHEAVEKLVERKRPFKNPILPDGTIKQGRPRKYPVGEDPKSVRELKKRKLEVSSIQPDLPQCQYQSRPTKRQRLEVKDAPGLADTNTSNSTRDPNKRGRPRRTQKEDHAKRDSTPVKRRGLRLGATPDRKSETQRALSAEETSSRATRKNRTRTSATNIRPDAIEEGEPTEKFYLPPLKRPRVTSKIVPVACELDRSAGAPSSTVLGTSVDHSASSLYISPPVEPVEAATHLPSCDKESPTHDPPSIISAQISRDQSGDPNPLRLLHIHPSTTPGISTTQQPSGADPVPIDPLLMDGIEATHQILYHSMTSTVTPPAGQNTSQLPTNPPTVLQSSSQVLKTDPRGNTLKGSRINVSHMRRENELYRVVQTMGGIVNIQTREFFEAHMALLELMTNAGEATSAPPGTRTDKRTAVSTFDKLERQGRIKQLKTSVITHTGVPRPTCIVYLPSVSQDALNTFLAELSRGVQPVSHTQNIVKIDEHIEYGADLASGSRSALPLQLLQLDQPGNDRKERWSKNLSRAEQLFSYDDSVIRDVLLTERTTLAQLYGFIVGKAVRSRELHLSALDAFERKDESPNIISHEKRIVDLAFFSHDITLGLYCSLISSLSYDDQLDRFVHTPEGHQTLVRNIPHHIHSALQIGRSRARTRFLDLLETLHVLKVVTPLQPSNSPNPWIICAASGSRPNGFDPAPSEGWTINTPMSAPAYWHFNDIAPVHVWAASETSPPFWQDVSVASGADAINFWKLLDEACRNPEIDISSNVASVTGSPTSVSVARSLRRRVSWNSEYIMTWHQMQYLRQFIDVASGKTPLQEEDEAAQIQKISWVTSAPEKSIRDFFQVGRTKILRDLDKLRKKDGKQSSDKKAKRTAATKASLAKKAADARLQREEAWEAILQRLHPAPVDPALAVRLRHIRIRFLQAASIKGLGKWEAQISENIREADAVATTVLKSHKKRSFASRAAPVPVETSPLAVAVNPPEKPIETLIAMQGPPLALEHSEGKSKRKRKSGQETEEEKHKILRRHRFQWNRDYDELARDSSAIIRARCRNLPRLDWAAFEQVFPAVPRNTVRQRLAHLRDTPGNEAYLNRLEDKWFEIWMQHRGTSTLPDDNPTSPSHFDLVKHVEFLRQHIDKNALRVGFAQPTRKANTTLPSTINELLQEYDVVESTPAAPSWDFMWNAVVEEGREKRMLRQPFLKSPENLPRAGEQPPQKVSLAESTLKMTLGTPHERYDSELASALLRRVGEQNVSAATKNLLNRGVLSKLVRDPQKQKPGRQLKISEVNQNAIGGSIPRDTFQDALALEDVSLQDNTWREWPLLATDGDTAALVQLVSGDKLEFKIDTSHAQSCRPSLDWNSKKADDDQIETVVHIRTTITAQPRPLAQSTDSSPTPTILNLAAEMDSAHGQCTDGGSAVCRRLDGPGAGLVDCMMCLEEERTHLYDTLIPEEKEWAQQMLMVVRQSGEHGITKSDLRFSTHAAITDSQLFSIIGRMIEWPIPLLFWAGYSSVVLVSSAYAKHWTILISENPIARMVPRRWMDISGTKIVDFWEAALKAVMGVVVFRPGLSQAELRWRLRLVYDRQEVNDVLRTLLEAGHLKIRCDPTLGLDDYFNVATLDDGEETRVYWFVGNEKHWYQV